MVTVGIDEVGRGCWAGPLVAAAVAFESSDSRVPTGLRDSKKLTKKRRAVLAKELHASIPTIGIGWVTPTEIDSLGLTKAVRLAMLRAVKQLHQVCNTYDEIIIDGNHNFFAGVKGLKTKSIRTEVRADDLYPVVSAASIVAKVARDTFMEEQALAYPDYGFEKHVGYGTAVHMEALRRQGVTKIHRHSFQPIQALLLREEGPDVFDVA